MRNLLFGLLCIAAGLSYFACSEKFSATGKDASITPANTFAVVLKDAKIDNAIEATNYETDMISTAEASISAYDQGALKSGHIMDYAFFKALFEHFPAFKFHYFKGITPNISIVTTNGGFPKTMVLDYGESTVLDNGTVLKGKITMVLSGAPKSWGTTISVTYANYSVDSIGISGTTVKTKTKDTAPTFSEKSDLTVTLADGTNLHRVAEKTRIWIAGFDTEFNPADDIINITGSVTVSDSKGDSYSRTITKPLVKKGTCKFITQGIIEFKNSNGKFATIDYGNGECDNLATLTNQQGTKQIIIK